MNTGNLKYYCCAFLASCVMSCDVLDISPVNIIPEEKAYETESSITAHFAKLYSQMLFEDFQICTSSYDPYVHWDQFEYYTGYGVAVESLDVIDNNGERIDGGMGYLWWDYSAVRNVNEFLQLIDKYSSNFTADQVKAWKAEAKVIRAWSYYTMAKRFGGVPLITEPQDVNNPDKEDLMVARASEKEIWDFIINEIDEAIAGGLKEVSEAQGRINKYVALTLKAQSALYAASIARYNSPILGIGDYRDPNTNKQVCGIPADQASYYYKIAFDAAKEVITADKFELARGLDADGATNFAKLFLEPDKHKEAIFVKYYLEEKRTHDWSVFRLPLPYGRPAMDNPTLDLIDLYDNLDGTSAKVAVNQGEWLAEEYTTLDEMFKGRDYRLGGTVYFPGCNFYNSTFDVRRGVIVDGQVKNGTGNVTVNGKTYSIRGKYGMGDTQDETHTGFLVRKYINEADIANVSPESTSWIDMRYAEVLLIAAEAAAELGIDENGIGLAALNDVRTRAGLPEVSELSIPDIRKQWACEFAFENEVFWCKRRWRVLEETLSNDFTCSGLEPYWDITNNKWKFKKIVASKYPKKSFLSRYYYNWINTSQITTNPKICQNYGY